MSFDSDKRTFEALESVIKKQYPKFKIIPKQKSWLHKTIGWVLKTFTANKTYMTNYWTTIGSTVAYPIEDKEGERYASWDILPHEGLHAGQSKRWSNFLMGSLYLLGTPVYFVIFLLLSIPFFIAGSLTSVLPWWSGFFPLALGLVLSVPVPFAYWRYRWEAQAYGLSMAVRYWTQGPDSVTEQYKDYLCEKFTNGSYFYMMPIKKIVRKQFDRSHKLLKQKSFFLNWCDGYYSGYFAAIYNCLKEQGRLVK